jgi:hypothetical protein
LFIVDKFAPLLAALVVQSFMNVSFPVFPHFLIPGRIGPAPRLTRIGRLNRRVLNVAGFCALLACASLAGQQASPATDTSASATDTAQLTPDAPTPQQTPDATKAQTPPADQPAQQTKRILGIIPNFRAISADQKLPAQSVKDKFVTATEDSFDYSAIFIPALLALYSEQTNATPEFGNGGVGYGRYFWHAAVDQTSENYMVEFIVPSLTHEDTRYYTLGRGGFLKRTGYAMSRAVVTRSDSGKEVFNASEVVGSGASAGLSSLYYPARERSFGNTGTEWGLDVEFWPDINHWLFHAAKPTVGASQ